MKLLSKCPHCNKFKIILTKYLVNTNLMKSKSVSSKEYICDYCWKKFPD